MDKMDGWLVRFLKDKATLDKIDAAIRKALSNTGASVRWGDSLGCGHFGCVFPITNGRPWILKITRDPTEGPMQTFVAQQQAEGEYGYEGFAYVKAVFRLSDDIDWRKKKWPVYAILREEITPVSSVMPSYFDKSEKVLEKMSPRPPSVASIRRAFSRLTDYQLASRAWYEAKRQSTKDRYETTMTEALHTIDDAFPYVGQIMAILQANGMPLQDVHAGNIGIRKHGGLTDIDPESGIGEVVIFDPGHTQSDRTKELEPKIARLNP